jgi:ribosomal small subunit protein bTHX
MGRGDKRTRKGKTFKGSFGKSRQRKKATDRKINAGQAQKQEK